jgi:hypothetical protein
VLSALAGIGPDAAGAVPALVDLLEAERSSGNDVTIQAYAVQALGCIGPAAADAVPAIASVLRAHAQSNPGLDSRRNDSSWETLIVLRSLYHIGVRSSEAERVLIGFIERNLPLVSENAQQTDLPSHFYLAVLTLGRAGAGSERAYRTISAVQQALEQRTSASHANQPPFHWDQYVLWALADAGVRPDDTVDVLLRALDESRARSAATGDVWNDSTLTAVYTGNSTPLFELVAIRGLGLFPECSERSLPVLMKTLEGDHHTARVAAVLALGELGEAARAAEPRLRRVAEDPISHADPVLTSAARGESTPRMFVDADLLPDPIWDFQPQLSAVSLGEAAREALERIAGR